jgi:hypothetical protein
MGNIQLAVRINDAREIARWRAENMALRVGDRIDRIRDCRQLRRLFKDRVGYELNLDNPRRYNEKIQWRKIYDRNPLFPIAADKVSVRGFLAERLGREASEEITIPHLFVAAHPDGIPFDRLPNSYVIKASHASGWNHFVRDGRHPRTGPERRKLLKWIGREYVQRLREWAYREMPRRLVGEPMITSEDGSFPDDLKFYMFDGECRVILHKIYGRQDTQSTPKVRRKLFMSPDWENLQIDSGDDPSGEPSPRPSGLARMMQIASALSADIDFVRVDFMVLPHRFHFGEMTFYPASGLKPFRPIEADDRFGDWWHLPKRTGR